MHSHLSAPSGIAAQRRAMRWSLSIGFVMFVGKGLAYLLTGSAAILSDAAESVVHVVAVGFAAYSLWLSHQPPDRNHLYGHEKIGFFSAGFEGSMIILAALFIIYESLYKWLVVGLKIEQIELGMVVICVATATNGILGAYLVRTGRREGSLILVANGKHVLTDSVTSLGVIVALVLVRVTGRNAIDPILAIAVALQILWSGVQLIRQSFRGLMDEGDLETDRLLRRILDEWAGASGRQHHDLRHRSAGNVVWVEVHLLFPGHQDLESAHAAATMLEDQIEREMHGNRVVVTTHLEPLEQHSNHHHQVQLPQSISADQMDSTKANRGLELRND